MTLLVNQALFSFEMRKYASSAEMNMILTYDYYKSTKEKMSPRQRGKLVWVFVEQPEQPWLHESLDFMWGGTFEKLVNLLRRFLEKRDRHFQKVTPVKKRVAVTFLRLANGNSLRKSFRKSTAVEITNNFREKLSHFYC